VHTKKAPLAFERAFSSSWVDHVQTIAPVALEQVLADCVCVEVAVHVCGPATMTATIVAFCEGEKPCSGVNFGIDDGLVNRR
jgi:hypothetical protein